MIPEEIIKNHTLEPYREGWLRGSIKLPNRHIYHFFKESEGGAYVFNVTIQNYENEETVNAFLDSIDGIIEKHTTFTGLFKSELINLAPFENVIFASFDYTIIPNSAYPDFDKRRVTIYPIYACELTGNESQKEIKHILKKGLSTTEWTREPSPLIRYKFTNPKHKYGTVGKSLVIDKEENVYSALSKFESEDCLMEVQNVLKEKLIISYLTDNKSYKISSENEESVLTYENILVHLKAFFRKK